MQTLNRTPRLPSRSASRPSLCRRLHNALRAFYLRWLLADLQVQIHSTERQLAADAATAHQLAQAHTYSHALASRRRDGRKHLAELTERVLTVRRELDTLQVQP